MQLLDADDDEDCEMVDHGESNQESTMGATHCSLNLNGNKIEVTWKSATKKQLLTYDANVATFIQYHYMYSRIAATTSAGSAGTPIL